MVQNFNTAVVIKVLNAEGFNGRAKRFKAAHPVQTVEGEVLMSWLRAEFYFPDSFYPPYLFEKMTDQQKAAENS